MEWIAVLAIIVVAAVIIPWAVSGIRLDRRGGGGLDAGLMELDRILNPSSTHAAEARRGPVGEEGGEGEPKDPPPPREPQ